MVGQEEMDQKWSGRIRNNKILNHVFYFKEKEGENRFMQYVKLGKRGVV